MFKNNDTRTRVIIIESFFSILMRVRLLSFFQTNLFLFQKNLFSSELSEFTWMHERIAWCVVFQKQDNLLLNMFFSLNYLMISVEKYACFRWNGKFFERFLFIFPWSRILDFSVNLYSIRLYSFCLKERIKLQYLPELVC
jgi:hypothetical protein